MLRPRNLVAALAATAMAAALPLAAATPAAAITPPQSLTMAGYGGYSSGEIAHVVALSTATQELTRDDLAQSAAGVAVGQPLVDVDTLQSRILFANQTGKNAYGHGAGLNVAIGQAPATPPQGTLALAEALSPPPNQQAAQTVVAIPPNPILTANVLNASARANTTSVNSLCLPGGQTLLSQGMASAANANILNVLPPTPPSTAMNSVVQLTTASQSISETRLVQQPSGNFGLTTFTTQTLADTTLAAGTPLETRIQALHDIQLRTTANGTPGGATVFFGFVDATGKPVPATEPVLSLTIGGQTQTLTSQQVLGPDGVRLNLGVADVIIGGPATSTTNPNGTSASGTADFIKITVPGTVPTGTNPVFSGPLAGLNAITTPLLSGLAPVLNQVQAGLQQAGLTAADIRLEHLEAQAKVPVGGIVCTSTPPGPGPNPFAGAQKDSSAVGVAPGATFEYTVRFPNRGTSPVTNVRVVDTFSGGPPPLEFISSTPAPTSRSGNTLTYDIGTLQPGQYADISLTFRVPANAPVGTQYRNEATITGVYQGTQLPPTTVDVIAPKVIPTPTGPCDVSRSTKYASELQVQTGENFAYYVNVSNTGGRACTGVTVTDTLGPGVEFVSCTDACTVSGRTVTWNVGTIASGASTTVSVRVRVTATSGTLPDTAHVRANEGSTANPSTPGPAVTGVIQPAPGKPAGCPATGCPSSQVAGESLARTGAAPVLPAAGGLLLLVGFALRRRQQRA